MPRGDGWVAANPTQFMRARDRVLSGNPPTPATGVFRRTVDDIVYDQFGPPLRTDGLFPTYGRHEAPLGGLNTGFDWYPGGKVNVAGPYPAGGYTHHNGWWQCFVAGSSTAERRVRLQVLVEWIGHLRAGVWTKYRDASTVGDAEGGYYRGSNFTIATAFTAAHMRSEVTGGHSFDLMPMTNADGTPSTTTTLGHGFWKGMFPRIPFLSNTTAVALVSRMRLISDVPGVDPNAAKFVAAFNGDLYGGAQDSGGIANAGFGQPRHKLLTSDWQSFTTVTGTEAAIRAYPTMPFLVP